MDEKQKQRLAEIKFQIINVVNEVMEMHFIDVEEADSQENYSENIDWLNLTTLYTAILILHPFPGELRLIVPRELAISMAQNIYVMEEEPSEQILDDLVAEMINVIAGRLMAQILRPHEKFKIGLPETGEDSFIQADTFSLAIDFNAEGLPLWLIACGEGFLNPPT